MAINHNIPGINTCFAQKKLRLAMYTNLIVPEDVHHGAPKSVEWTDHPDQCGIQLFVS